MWPTARYNRFNRVKYIMVLKTQEKLKDDLELDHFVTNLLHVVNNDMLADSESHKEHQMMFLGFMFMHREECQATNCPLKNNNPLYLPSNDTTSKRDAFPSKDKILHQHFVNSVFIEY